jgi:hypothetical protein
MRRANAEDIKSEGTAENRQLGENLCLLSSLVKLGPPTFSRIVQAIAWYPCFTPNLALLSLPSIGRRSRTTRDEPVLAPVLVIELLFQSFFGRCRCLSVVLSCLE